MNNGLVTGIGVAATVILMATLLGQTWKQWRERTTKGVARWFFLGQVSASVGFVAYSLLTGSVLFAVTNGLILLSALAGYVVLRINRRRLTCPPRAETHAPVPAARPATRHEKGETLHPPLHGGLHALR